MKVRVAFAVRGAAPDRLATLQDSSGVFGEKGIYAAAAFNVLAMLTVLQLPGRRAAIQRT